MKLSRKFRELTVVHEGVHYFIDSFIYGSKNVEAPVALKLSNSWVSDNIKTTIKLADKLKEYAECHKLS